MISEEKVAIVLFPIILLPTFSFPFPTIFTSCSALQPAADSCITNSCAEIHTEDLLCAAHTLYYYEFTATEDIFVPEKKILNGLQVLASETATIQFYFST